MFGIDQVSWGQFIQGSLLVLLLWYLSLVFFSFLKRKGRDHKTMFEDDFAGPVKAEDLQPVTVTSQDFPFEMVPLVPFGAVALSVSFYEEVGVDDGYALDRRQASKDPLPQSVMQQFQFRQ